MMFHVPKSRKGSALADHQRYRRYDRHSVSALNEQADRERHQQEAAQKRELAWESHLSSIAQNTIFVRRIVRLLLKMTVLW